MAARWMTLADLEHAFGAPDAHEDLSAATGTPVIVVDVAGAPGTAGGALAARLADLPCVTVAVGTGTAAAGFDVAVTDTDAAAEVAAAVEQAPIAATALAVLLRGGATHTTAEGLAAESAVYSTLQAGPEFTAWRAARPIKTRPPATDPAVLFDLDGSVLHITLNRPRRHNAFSVEVRDGLVEALTFALGDPAISRVILDGVGPSFCSGGDLDEFGQRPDPAQAHLVRLTRSAARLVDRLADRIEVHLHGACMGAGIEVPAFAGYVVAHPDAVIALPEVPLGLVPGAGGTVSLPRRIGRQRTAWMGITGAHVDAATALAWGLVDAVETVDAGQPIVR